MEDNEAYNDRCNDWEEIEEQDQEELTWNQQLWNDIGYSNCL
jgi:hypothetical protein